MPEGMAMGCRVEGVSILPLEEAIARLESGEAAGDMQVDLGDGRIAQADGPNGEPGLLQRLRGHRLLLAMSEDIAVLPGPTDDIMIVSNDVRELLDAVKKAR